MLLYIGLYVISVILSYLMFRQMLINEEKRNEAKYYPHLFLFIVTLIPAYNIIISLILFLMSYNINIAFNYKNFWRIK